MSVSVCCCKSWLYLKLPCRWSIKLTKSTKSECQLKCYNERIEAVTFDFSIVLCVAFLFLSPSFFVCLLFFMCSWNWATFFYILLLFCAGWFYSAPFRSSVTINKRITCHSCIVVSIELNFVTFHKVSFEQNHIKWNVNISSE